MYFFWIPLLDHSIITMFFAHSRTTHPPNWTKFPVGPLGVRLLFILPLLAPTFSPNLCSGEKNVPLFRTFVAMPIPPLLSGPYRLPLSAQSRRVTFPPPHFYPDLDFFLPIAFADTNRLFRPECCVDRPPTCGGVPGSFSFVDLALKG